MSDGIHFKLDASCYISNDGELQITINLSGGVSGQFGHHHLLDSTILYIDGQEWMRKIASARLKGD